MTDVAENPSSVLAELQRIVAASALFSGMDARGVQRLADIARTETFRPNETIVQEGAMSRLFYIIVQGGVRVIAEAADAAEVARLGAGQFFGEMGILNEEPRSASVRAIGETRCLLFDKTPLLAILEDYPQILHGLGAVSVQRASKLSEVNS